MKQDADLCWAKKRNRAILVLVVIMKIIIMDMDMEMEMEMDMDMEMEMKPLGQVDWLRKSTLLCSLQICLLPKAAVIYRRPMKPIRVACLVTKH